MNRSQTPHWLSSVASHAGDLATLRSAWADAERVEARVRAVLRRAGVELA